MCEYWKYIENSIKDIISIKEKINNPEKAINLKINFNKNDKELINILNIIKNFGGFENSKEMMQNSEVNKEEHYSEIFKENDELADFLAV